jgi:CcmD family protein
MSTVNGVRRMCMLIGAALLLLSMQVARVSAFGQQGFVPSSSLPQQQSVSAPLLVLVAYGLVWLFVAAYVWSISRRLGAIEQELADARREFSVRNAGRP